MSTGSKPRWQRLHGGVYGVFTGSPDRQMMLWAAVLRAGPGAVLSHQSAAELDGLIDKPAPSVYVTVPANRRVGQIDGVLVRTRRDASQIQHPSRLPPRTRLEETVLDLADQAGDIWSATNWITGALGRRLTTQDLLRDALVRRPKFRWRADVSLVLSPDLAGIHSALEFRYYRDVERPHRLPKARRQARAVQGTTSRYRDVLYEEFGLVVELDGRVAHPGDSRWLDIQRDNAAAAGGLVTLRYGHRELATQPCLVTREVAQVLRLRGWTRAPHPCSPTCPVADSRLP